MVSNEGLLRDRKEKSGLLVWFGLFLVWVFFVNCGSNFSSVKQELFDLSSPKYLSGCLLGGKGP